MSPLQLHRLGTVMEPQPGNAQEVEGVLNPAAARGPDGELYLFPRLVAKGNYSRIGIARVKFNDKGDPDGVERLGIALEPEAPYELRPNGGGGCEDPRVTFIEPLRQYFMSYVAFSAHGPRIALASSTDLFHWLRLGLVQFDPWEGIDFAGVDDKDASFFPVAIPNPTEHSEMALLHRPLFKGTRPDEIVREIAPHLVDPDRECIWISYTPAHLASGDFTSHHRLAVPIEPWECLKIGGGTPPILTRHGWLIVYHGVCEMAHPKPGTHPLRYSAGAMILSREHPQIVRYRSPQPVLTPSLPNECSGTVANVVFPTGIDRRNDLGLPDRYDVYYGMADNRIGVARLDIPEVLPEEAPSETH